MQSLCSVRAVTRVPHIEEYHEIGESMWIDAAGKKGLMRLEQSDQ